jgi:hypothetical protein
MHILEQLYLTLGTYIKNSLVNNDDDPIFKFVDLWSEQTEYKGDDEEDDEELPFDLPACFVDINVPQMNDIGMYGKEYDTEIDLYITFDTLADTHIGASNQSSALGLFALALKCFEQLNGYTDNDFKGTLNGVGFVRYKTRSNLIMYKLRFTTLLRDQSATEYRKPIEVVTLDLEADIQKSPHQIPNAGGTKNDLFKLE